MGVAHRQHRCAIWVLCALGGGGAGWAPLDDQFGAQRGYTPGCQYFMACFCGRQPYQESLDHFHEVFRADGQRKVSMRKAYQMTCAANQGLDSSASRVGLAPVWWTVNR